MQDLLSKMCCNCSEVSTLLDGPVTFCAGTNYFCGLCWQSGTWNVVRAGSNWKAQLHNPCRTFSQHTFSVCTCEHHQVKRNQKSCANLLTTRRDWGKALYYQQVTNLEQLDDVLHSWPDFKKGVVKPSNSLNETPGSTMQFTQLRNFLNVANVAQSVFELSFIGWPGYIT